MATAVLLDESTVIVQPGAGSRSSVPLAKLSATLVEPTDVAVVACEIARIVAPTPASLEAQIAARFDATWVTCSESVDTNVHQVFGMKAATLETLRDIPHVRSVVPYPLAAREGLRGAGVSWTQVARRQTATGKSDELLESDSSWATIDVIDHFVLVTGGIGPEIRALRLVARDRNLEREIFVTLQGAQLRRPWLCTLDHEVGDKLRGEDHDVDVLELPDHGVSFGMFGLAKAGAARFHLPAELADIRRREVEQRLWRGFWVAAGVCVASVLFCIVAMARSYRLDSQLAELERSQTERKAQAQKLYHERYANWVAATAIDAPQAWSELRFVVPPQLVIKEVNVAGNLLRAQLTRRRVDEYRDPPLTLKDLRAALAASTIWTGAKVTLSLEAHAVSYMVEKRR